MQPTSHRGIKFRILLDKHQRKPILHQGIGCVPSFWSTATVCLFVLHEIKPLGKLRSEGRLKETPYDHVCFGIEMGDRCLNKNRPSRLVYFVLIRYK